MLKILLLLTGLIGLPFNLTAAEAVDINTADRETLVSSLNGIGPARADAIIAYREKHGPFMSVEELTEVRGIGASIVERNREVLTVMPLTEAPPEVTDDN